MIGFDRGVDPFFVLVDEVNMSTIWVPSCVRRWVQVCMPW